MNAITVGLVLEHRMVVDVLTSWFHRRAPADIQLVATATVTTIVRGNLDDATVIITDLHSPAAHTSFEEDATTFVLLLSSPGADQFGDEHVRAYVSLMDEVDVLIDAIRSAAQSTTTPATPFHSPRIAEVIDAERIQAIEIPEDAVVLTAKQRRVLDLYVDGLTAQEIAESLGMARNTVWTYIKNVRAKYRTAGIPVGNKIELLHAARSPTTITKPRITRKQAQRAAAAAEKKKVRDSAEAERALPRLDTIVLPEADSPPLTLTVADLSRIFGLDEKTVRWHLSTGAIPAYRVKHHWLIFTAEVRSLFDDPESPDSSRPDIFADYGDTMKPRDVQDLFGMSRQTINFWLKQGTLPGYRIGTRWLIHTHQLRHALTTYSNRNAHVLETEDASETFSEPASELTS